MVKKIKELIKTEKKETKVSVYVSHNLGRWKLMVTFVYVSETASTLP